MTENQRENYPSIVTRCFGNPSVNNYILHQVLLTCFERNDKDAPRIKYLEDFCAPCPQWRVMSTEDIMESKKLTESELYNTFWHGDWVCLTD